MTDVFLVGLVPAVFGKSKVALDPSLRPYYKDFQNSSISNQVRFLLPSQARVRKVEETSMTTRCMTCEQPFKYSMYAISVKGSSVPPVCRSCEQGEVWKLIH